MINVNFCFGDDVTPCDNITPKEHIIPNKSKCQTIVSANHFTFAPSSLFHQQIERAFELHRFYGKGMRDPTKFSQKYISKRCDHEQIFIVNLNSFSERSNPGDFYVTSSDEKTLKFRLFWTMNRQRYI